MEAADSCSQVSFRLFDRWCCQTTWEVVQQLEVAYSSPMTDRPELLFTSDQAEQYSAGEGGAGQPVASGASRVRRPASQHGISC